MKTVPTEADWRGTFWEQLREWLIFGQWPSDLGLDGEHAFRQFFGKTHAEAFELFRDDALSRQVDLVWMPFRCFQFYVEAYVEYLNSEFAVNDSDGANGFFGMTLLRMHEIRKLNTPLKTRIIDTLKFLGSNQDRFNAEQIYYGSFSDTANSLLRELERSSDSPPNQSLGVGQR